MAHTIETNIGGAGSAPVKPHRAFGKVRRVVVKCLQTVMIWQERAEQRHALAELNAQCSRTLASATRTHTKRSANRSGCRNIS
jgi:hypothetical protein